MNKRFLAILIAAFATSHVTAGSLDVYGDIKVNGKTIIDGEGNYVGNLPKDDKSVTLSEYTNQTGLKKTYNQERLVSGGVLQFGTRIDDNSNPNVNVITYNWSNDNGPVSSWVSSETHESSSAWVIEGHDNSGGDFSSIQRYSRTWFTPQDPKTLAIGESYLIIYEDAVTSTSKGTQCTTSQDSEGNITNDDCEPYESTQEYTNSGKQTVSLLGKTEYKKGDISYDDCIVMQYSSGNEPWTAVSCKGVGLVYGWGGSYKVELIKSEGSLQNSSPLAVISSRIDPVSIMPKIKR